MAMLSKRSLESWLMIDNRASGGKLVEVPTYTCSHCQQQVMANPGRTRDRFECPRCDKVLCARCETNYRLTDDCRNFQRHLDQIERNAYRELSRNTTIDPRLVVL